MKFLLSALLFVFGQLTALESAEHPVSVRPTVGAIRVATTGDNDFIVDSSGKPIAELAANEVIQNQVLNDDGDVRVLQLCFVQRLGKDTVSGWYSRLLVIYRMQDGTLVARNTLGYTDPFMVDGKKWIKKLISVSNDARYVSVEVGILKGEKYLYERRKMSLTLPKFLD
jgi:hypothetical protein